MSALGVPTIRSFPFVPTMTRAPTAPAERRRAATTRTASRIITYDEVLLAEFVPGRLRSEIVGKVSQAIADGEGISIIVEVGDSPGAHAAAAQGAHGLAAGEGIHAVRAASQLPLLALGSLFDASGVRADAIAIGPDVALWDEAHAHDLECVVRVTTPDAIAYALEHLDPEVFLLSADPESEEDPLELLLELLHDVPAGKLAIAELHDATLDDVAELERSGVDAVLVAAGDVVSLVGAETPEV